MIESTASRRTSSRGAASAAHSRCAATFASMTVRENVVLSLLAHAGRHGAMLTGSASELAERRGGVC